MFVFFSEGADDYWVMPSLDLVKEATRNKEGINAGRREVPSRAMAVQERAWQAPRCP
jgi:hypothetical protein